jgi:hypothetical protein
MKTDIHLWYHAQFFLAWEMFQAKVVRKIKTHTFQKSWRLSDNVEKYNTTDQATDDIWFVFDRASST